jgi:transcriptional regulator with XRE-family HTH domain
MKRVHDAELARLGARLRTLREDLGLSQREVADRLGLSDVGYGHFERGRRIPSAAELPWLAGGFGVSTVDLMARLGLMDQKLFDQPVPELIAARLARIVTNWQLLDPAEKAHVAAMLGPLSEFCRRDADAPPSRALVLV